MYYVLNFLIQEVFPYFNSILIRYYAKMTIQKTNETVTLRDIKSASAAFRLYIF